MIYIIVVTLIMLSIVLIKYLARQEAKKSVDDFIKRFPNKCPICSFHRFGIVSGFETNPEPPAHNHCIEKSVISRNQNSIW